MTGCTKSENHHERRSLSHVIGEDSALRLPPTGGISFAHSTQESIIRLAQPRRAPWRRGHVVVPERGCVPHIILFIYSTPSCPRCYAGFASAGWAYAVIAALGVVGFYKFAPSRDEDNYVTRYIAHYFTPSSTWASTNDHHLELTASLQEAIQISQTGQRPHIHRYRYPQYVCALEFSLFDMLNYCGSSLEVASAFSVPVGGDPDVSGVRVKGGNEL